MPKITIVVPTRERSDTLRHTLETLVQQDYADLQILVSDNASQDDTFKVVSSFNDVRINYVNTGKRVSMSENWEFALSHAVGEFITFIGDDDGFLPGSITKAMKLLQQTNVPALIWRKAEYHWLDYPVPAMQNLMVTETHAPCAIYVRAAAQLKRVMASKAAYVTLPCLYNGIVRRNLLEEIKSKSAGGIFFNSISPDVYSGIALSLFMDEYLYVNYPFSVNGASRHSNGTSFIRTDGFDPLSPAGRFKQENLRQYDARIQFGPSVLICVMGEYMLVKESLKQLALPEPDWASYVRKLSASAPQSFLPEHVARSAEFTAKKIGIALKATPVFEHRQEKTLHPMPIRTGTTFTAPPELVKNVYDACLLVYALSPADIQIAHRNALLHSLSFVRAVFSHIKFEIKKLYRLLRQDVV